MKYRLTKGFFNAHNAPPSLQLICKAIFSVTLFNLSGFEIVLDIITCDGVGDSTQQTLKYIK